MKNCLLGTNILVYYLAGEIPSTEHTQINEALKISFNISVITKIEYLGWSGFSPHDFAKTKLFLSFSSKCNNAR